MQAEPTIIQGGMGAGVSNWRLANAVARIGQLGVVSGTAINVILTRRLQLGNPAGTCAARWPPSGARPGGGRTGALFPPAGEAARCRVPMANGIHTAHPRAALQALTVVANFVEVFLAKEGHDGRVRDQPAGEDPTADFPRLALRCAAGRGRLRAGGGG